ncbi:hypothetical protein TNCV_4272481 [Trichonephila clavipes]|nr:hypothetical protein TNCV_4272481 [Trichonephila clavipes]
MDKEVGIQPDPLDGSIHLSSRRLPQNVLAIHRSIAIDLMPTPDLEHGSANQESCGVPNQFKHIFQHDTQSDMTETIQFPREYAQAESVPEPDKIDNVVEDVVDLATQINLEVDSDDVQELCWILTIKVSRKLSNSFTKI